MLRINSSPFLSSGMAQLTLAILLFWSAPAAQATGEEKELSGGKTLTEWIAQAKNALKLSDREDALQTLRNLGLLLRTAC